MYHLVTRNLSGYYNIYCDVVHDTTGVEVSIEECFSQFHMIESKKSESLEAFLKRYNCILVVSFASFNFDEFKSTYPELFI